MSLLTFVAIFHVLVAIFLIVLVLLQDSKGGAMGMLGGGGGGSNTVFGSTGAGNFLTTATKWVAILFAVTCIALAYMTTQKDTSVLDDYVPAAGSTQQNTLEGVESKQDETKAPEEKSTPKE